MSKQKRNTNVLPRPPKQAQRKVKSDRVATKSSKALLKKLGLTASDHMPDVHVWSSVLKNPFTYDPGDVGMPLNEDNFPCKSVKTRNYSSQTLVWGASPSDVQIHFYADASAEAITTPEGDRVYQRCLFNASALSGFPGLVLDTNAGSSAEGIAFGYIYATVGNDFSMAQLTNSLAPALYDRLSVPATINYVTGQAPNIQARTYAYGIRITYLGALLNAKGYVEFVCSREAVGRSSTTAPTFNGLRDKDPSYRRFFFGDKRTVQYHWSPNCDSVKYGIISGGTAASNTVNSRIACRIGGMVENDEVLVEVMHFQEFQGNLFSAISTLTPQTQDAVAVSNALVSGHGLSQPTMGGAQPVPLHTEAMAQKVQQHPIIRKLGNMAEGAGALTIARKIGTKLLTGAGDLLGDAEMLSPLLMA
jgi:hypothetical protein